MQLVDVDIKDRQTERQTDRLGMKHGWVRLGCRQGGIGRRRKREAEKKDKRWEISIKQGEKSQGSRKKIKGEEE